jgi:hypothetical protein
MATAGPPADVPRQRAPAVPGPGAADPGLVDPGLVDPGLVDPGLVGSGLVGSGTASGPPPAGPDVTERTGPALSGGAETGAATMPAAGGAAGPGCGLVARFAVVDAVIDETFADLGRSAEEDLFDLVVLLLGRQTARLQALAIRAQAQLAALRPVLGQDDEDGPPYSGFLADELAADMNQCPRTVGNDLAQAWDLADRLPAAVDALAAGDLDLRRLRALADVTATLTDGQRATIEAAMLAGSPLASAAHWRRKIHRLVHRLDPDTAAKRRRQAHADRSLTIRPLADGMAQLTAILAAEDARAIHDRIDQLAHSDARADATTGLDPRPIAARRADVLTALLLGNRREHVHVDVHVIAPLGTLAGLDDNPAELVGYGPIPADVGRALAADAHWRRVLTDPKTGTVLDLGHRRIPTPALARLIRHRDTCCVFPGCGMPATHTDIDHTTAHAAGGHTSYNNLGLLCRHHHRMKHDGGWTLEQPTPGHFIWTSRAGRTYTTDHSTDTEEPRLPTEDHTHWTPHPPTQPPNTRTDDPCPF